MQLRADKGLPPVDKRERLSKVRELLELWLAGLTNRTARKDRYCVRLYLVAEFGDLTMPDLTMPRVVAWLDKLKARAGEERLSTAYQRRMFDLLSRFFAWAIERGHCPVNVCRQIPQGSKVRPSTRPERVRPWIQDPALALAIYRALPYPFDLMFLIGFTSGMRPGEICGLRLSDCAWLNDEDPEGRVLRVRYNRTGPLKEDKGTGRAAKIKWAITSDELIEQLKPHLERRRRQGANDEDFVFPSVSGRVLDAPRICEAWKSLTATEGKPCRGGHRGRGLTLPDELDWYAATRHTFVNRQLSADARTDTTSEALGHADGGMLMKRHYTHVIRKRFPASMRRGLGLPAVPGEVPAIAAPAGPANATPPPESIPSDAATPTNVIPFPRPTPTQSAPAPALPVSA
jgi:integrase